MWKEVNPLFTAFRAKHTLKVLLMSLMDDRKIFTTRFFINIDEPMKFDQVLCKDFPELKVHEMKHDTEFV
mgnify:CR=1 FL=1